MRLTRPSSHVCGSLASLKLASGRTTSLRIDRVDDVGRDDDQQFGLLPQIVARAEQAAENRHVHQAGNAVIACCVWSEIKPAEAIEPPDGNSTVVSFLRVRNPGIDVLAIVQRVRACRCR